MKESEFIPNKLPGRKINCLNKFRTGVSGHSVSVPGNLHNRGTRA
jgi:hypothetical protein